ncbi:MAG: hypothetical protein RLZZ524_1234 [Pseudomonadota bacterium]
MEWEWKQALHSLSDPAWAVGLAMQARRADDAAMPLGKRLLYSVGPVLLSAFLSAGGAVLGTLQAVRAEISSQISALHEEDIRIRSTIQERTTLREQQMTEFRSLCSEAHSRIAVLESRQRDSELLAAELRAFMRHEQAEWQTQRGKQ